MRNGQKRMRGRGGHRKSQNPLTRVYESNGPDVKIRGTASHVAEKYIQLARDAQSSGDPVAAENYYQHAEHYFRLIAAAQEQFRQQNPYYQQQQPQQGAQQNADDNFDEDGDETQTYMGQNEPSFVQREGQPQPYLPPNAQPFPPRDQQQTRAPQQQPGDEQPASGLPAFITGGNQPQPNSGNGHDQSERGQGGQDRHGGGFRRRRRHRGGGFRERPDFAGAQGASAPGEGGSDEPQPGE
jgi:Domain of unknown function (DUF4167)